MTRITQAMLYARALRDVQANLRGSQRLQEQVATGRRVNRPSDDPAGMLRILPLRAELRRLDQLTSNTQLARETTDLGASALEDASELMQQTRELLIQANNGTTSVNDLVGLGERVDQLLGQFAGIANTSRAGRFLFGGTITDQPPFRLEEGPGGTRARYDGNGESVLIEVGPGVETALNAPGDSIFLRRRRGATTFANGGTGAQPGPDSSTGVGFGELRVAFAGLGGAPAQITAGTGTTDALGSLTYAVSGSTLSIDGGPPVPIPATNQDFQTADGRTVNLTISGTPVPPNGTFTSLAGLSIDGGQTVTVADFASSTVQVRDSEGTVLSVDVGNLNATGTESVTYGGTFDPFTLLIEFRDTLRGATTDNQGETKARLQRILQEVDGAHDGILDGIAVYGGRSEQMDALRARMDSLGVSTRESLSNVEDSDLTESIMRMTQQQIVYEASLSVSARIVQTSLLDYLR
ncbi:MAG: flagellar hook-associated protein FlgL [Planctomycetota bacterium]